MPAKKSILSLAVSVGLLVFGAGLSMAQTYLDLEDQIQEFTLDNGVRFIVLENHDVPVFSFRTFVNVGSANEVRGITGLSHILEHMAFKGTTEIGTNDYKKEKKAMAVEDETFDAFKETRLSMKPVLARYEQLVARIPEDRMADFREMENALNDLPVEVSVAFDGTSGLTDITHGIGSEEEATNQFQIGPEEHEALQFYLQDLKELKEDYVAREQAFTEAKDAAREFVETNEYGSIVEKNGGRGLNAYTNSDVTVYHYNMPSNRLELWAYLEGSRMAQPVLREYYTEKGGPVTEERRMRTDNNPIGRLIEIFQNQMFMANGYHHGTIGYMSDIENMNRADCRKYFEENYVGSNMVVTVVGDVYFDEVKKVAEKYFKDIPAGNPQPVETFEPKQLVEKRLIMQDPSQPIFGAGFHIENIQHPDWPVYEVIADVLGQGRTSRLYKDLVKEQQIAVQAMSFPGFPGQKYQTGMLVIAIPVKGKTGYDMEAAVMNQIDLLVEDGISADELAAVKQRTRANFIRGLGSNGGMASQLASYQTYFGDWRELFNEVDRINAVTLDDVKRVAAEIFAKSNRTIAIIETEEEDS